MVIRNKIFEFFFFLYLIIISQKTFAQSYRAIGCVIDIETESPISNVNILNNNGDILTTSDRDGFFNIVSSNKILDILILHDNYYNYHEEILINDTIIISLNPLLIKIDEVNINDKKNQDYKIVRLNDIEGTNIYAGKKSEAILISDINSGLSMNNTRLIYNQISGLNIYESDDAGIQLNIGGRGLDPNRTSNFNTRQNGYDISADVLGYPESYYTPPSESLERIEIIRGAASLQYGTQFGGLVNFKIKEPSVSNVINIRNTLGSNNLYTNFTSIGGVNNKLRYYSFFNYKIGSGFRENSDFKSVNYYLRLALDINTKLTWSSEFTYFTSLSQQAGGLTDIMFNEDPSQSNRTRNWFNVDWLLFNSKLLHKINSKNTYSISINLLQANRDALGFRSNRVDQVDPFKERDLIKGEFNNFSFETKYISNNNIISFPTLSLLGFKYYESNNYSFQGPGSLGVDPDFDFIESLYYPYQSSYNYPNKNVSLFTEHVFYFTENLSVTPGVRYERIITTSDGSFQKINLDAANNPIFDTLIYNSTINDRHFFLKGIGTSYKFNNHEFYINISQNYRSVTFSDISIFNPSFMIDSNITDESGSTFDFGLRGFNDFISYEISPFQILYNNRIGFVQRLHENGSVKSVRSNIGKAKISGIESLFVFNLRKIIKGAYRVNLFINTALINSEYIDSEEKIIEGNNVEFVPKLNLKTGFTLGYKDVITNLQFTYLSDQYTDATNANSSNISGIIGKIPAYNILDLNSKYTIHNIQFEFGINNLLNRSYFTRRATGYPGPGIIPSPLRNYYLTFQINI